MAPHRSPAAPDYSRNAGRPPLLPPAGRWRRLLCAGAALLAGASIHPGRAGAAAPVPVAIADFENIDTSGESGERTGAHAARVERFDDRLRDLLATGGAFRIVPLVCPQSPCSPGRVPAAEFLAAARGSHARLVVYGRIQKLSTLVQIGVVQALDLQTEELVVDQRITFRGDSDEAFRRAAEFVASYLRDVSLEP